MIGKFSELPYHTKSPPGDAHSRAWKMLPFGNRARRENSTLWNSFSYDRKVLGNRPRGRLKCQKKVLLR